MPHLIENRRLRLPLLVVLVALFMLVLWQVADWTRDRALGALERQIEADLGRYTLALRKELEKYEKLPELLATHRGLLDALSQPDDLIGLHQLNRYLEEVARITGASDIYLMDPSGLTLSSSNWQQDPSFVGRSFHYRPYFIQAMQGRPGRYFALGSTSHKRGYYFSYPVQGNGGVLGVVVVKVDLMDIEEQWNDPLVDLVVTDIDGVVFISTRPDWKFKSLRPLSQEDRKRILNSKRYADQPLGAIPLLNRQPFSRHSELLTLLETGSRSELRGLHGNQFLVSRTALPDLELRVVAMGRLTNVERQVLNAVLLAGFTFVLLVMSLLFGLMRRRIRLERLRFKQQTTRALEASEARVRAIIDNTQAGLITLDAQGRIESFNPTAEALFGYRFDEVTGRDFSQLIDETDRTLYWQMINRHAQVPPGKSRPVVETLGRRKDQTGFPMELTIGEMFHQGELKRVATLHDITQRKEYEEGLRRARDELETRVEERTADLKASNERLRMEIEQHRHTQDELIQTAKLAVIGQMSAGINHELNQPLAAIRAYADNAKAFLDRQQPLKAHANLTEIAGQTDRMAKIIGALKVFARKSGDQSEPVALKSVIDGALSVLYPRLQKEGVQIDCPPEADALTVQGDMVRLEQVLVNLIANALQAMEGQTEKSVEIQAGETTGGWIQLSVRDVGPGIPQTELARVFEPFYTTKDVGQGLGLGLSISLRIVESLQGRLDAANHPQGGAVFTLSLPKASSVQVADLR